MAKIQILTRIGAEHALAAGMTEHGEILVTPTAEEIGALTAEQRQALAPHVAGTMAKALSVTAPGWPGVLAGLERESADRREKEAENEQAIERERESYRQILASGRYYEPGSMPPKLVRHGVFWQLSPNYGKSDPEAIRLWKQIETAREEERRRMILEADAKLVYDTQGRDLAGPIVAVLDASRVYRGGAYVMDPEPPRALEFQERHRRELEAADRVAAEKAHAELRALITEHGTEDQVERFDAGVLPSDEQEAIIAKALFAPLAHLPEYDEISEQEVAEECDCDLDEVKFSASTVAQPELTAEQFSRLKAVKLALPQGATLDIREHVGYERGRDGADDPEIRRLGARVTIEFAGEKHRREYAI